MKKVVTLEQAQKTRGELDSWINRATWEHPDQRVRQLVRSVVDRVLRGGHDVRVGMAADGSARFPLTCVLGRRRFTFSISRRFKYVTSTVPAIGSKTKVWRTADDVDREWCSSVMAANTRKRS